jgi:SPP1 gp7 family putative phage head morphogenesis protein
MKNYFDERYKFTHRLEGVVNAFGEDIAQTLAGALETITGKLMRLTAAAESTPSLVRKREFLLKRKAEIGTTLAEIYQGIGQDMQARSVETALATPEILNGIIESTLPENVSARLTWAHVTKDRVLAWWDSAQIEGTFFTDYLKKLETSAAERVLQAARQSLLLDESMKESAASIQKALDIGARSAQRVLRTALHSAVNWAEREVYRENSDRFKSFKFQAELDRGTCEYCAFLDSREYDLQDAPAPPVHFACRCFLYPVFRDVFVDGQDEPVPYEDALGEDYDKVARRIARLDTDPRTVHHRDGTTSTAYQGYEVKFVDRRMNYRQWMQSMVKSSDPGDVAFAREALGPTRFSLVESGKLKVEGLYYQGKLKSVKDLKELMRS